MPLTAAILLIGQVGPGPALNLPTGLEDRQRRSSATAPVESTPAPKSPLAECMDAVKGDPPAAIGMAESWLAQAKGSATAPAQFCLGSAHAALGHWDEAEQAFVAGRDVAASSDLRLKAQLGAMAGTTALAAGANERALALLDKAHADALAVPDVQLGGDISVDRSRALVALKREADASQALTEARTATPANPDAWLLSATLSRRQKKLGEAQAQIEKAVELAPRDPQVGLEAGVIAVLSGRDDAARKSWQSVIAAAPESEEAKTAQGYIEQLGPAPTAAQAAK